MSTALTYIKKIQWDVRTVPASHKKFKEAGANSYPFELLRWPGHSKAVPVLGVRQKVLNVPHRVRFRAFCHNPTSGTGGKAAVCLSRLESLWAKGFRLKHKFCSALFSRPERWPALLNNSAWTAFLRKPGRPRSRQRGPEA